MNKTSTQFLRKRKFYLLLPLLVLPFITLAFWALGGGITDEESLEKKATGLNMQLPDAKFNEDKNTDKLSFYQEAEKDSLKNAELLKNDPNYKPQEDSGLNVLEFIAKSSSDQSGYNAGVTGMMQSPFSSGSLDANETKVYKKINELKKQMDQSYESKSPQEPAPTLQSNNSSNEDFSQDVEKLQSMMQTMSGKEADPEMDQLNGMINSILDIQHPERVKERLKEKSIKNKEQVFAVSRYLKNDNISLMKSGNRNDTTIKVATNGFYDLSNNRPKEANEDRSIDAVIHQAQTVVAGSTVKLRLSTDIYINGILIPKGNFVYGTAALDNERLQIKINSVRYLNNILPVDISVYDMDGLEGVHIPGSISKEVVKQSGEQSLQNMDFSSLDPSLAAQLTNASITAAKSLLGKRSKLVKIHLRAGYKILLKDNNKQ